MASAMDDYMTTNIFLMVIIILFVIYLAYYVYSAINDTTTKREERAQKNRTSSICPNYWEVVSVKKDTNGNSIVTCKNSKFIGKCSLMPDKNEFTFSDEIFLNPGTKDMAKCKFAKQCDITWTGYDNLCSA